MSCSSAPDALGPEWQVEPIVARSLRASVPGTVRLPSALLGAASPALRRSLGHVMYRGRDLVHRLDLRLPPAPSGEFLTIHDVVPWRFVDERAAVPTQQKVHGGQRWSSALRSSRRPR